MTRVWLFVACWALSGVTAEAQPRVVYRALQLNAVAAPIADAYTTLASNDNPHLVERNPLQRRADGTASPPKVLLMKAGQTALLLSVLHLARSRELDEARGVRWLAVGVVVLLNGLEWRAAVHNARLDRRTR